MVTGNAPLPIRLLAAAFVLSASAAAHADPLPPVARVERIRTEPRAHHEPVSSAKEHEPLRITVSLDNADLVRSMAVIFRSAKGELRMVPLLRGEHDGYVAIIPGEEVSAPGIAYAVEVQLLDGRRVPLFASRAALHPVQVLEDHADVRERALLKRLDGRRSVVTASGEFVRFGRTTSSYAIPCAAQQSACAEGSQVRPSVEDQFWRVEVGYTYRPLRAVAEFGLKIGVVRGTSLVDLPEFDESKYKVGLNYASPSVRFRFHDHWHLDLDLVTSITEIGFSVGGGGALLIGDPWSTHLTFGAEVVGWARSTYFGSRFYTRYDVMIHERVTIAPVIEVTDMPHAEAFGVRLYGDVNANLGRGFSIGVRGGYQARRSTSGGVGLGGTVAYAF